MAAGEEKLRLVLAAIDKTAAPLRAINRRIESLTAPVRKVRNAFRSLAKEAHLPALGAGIAKVAGWARNLGIAAVGAGAGLLAFTERTADSADSLAEFTRLVGIGVEEFQELQWAAKRAGIDGEVFSAAMKSLAKNVGDAKAGTGRLAGLLKKVSPVTLKQIQATQSTGEALEVVLAAMRKLPDASKRNALASKAFGNSMLGLLATLSPDEIKAFREEAASLGIVMSTKTATAAESLMDNVDALKASVVGLAKRIAESLFPDLQSVTDELLIWIKANRALIVSKGREWILKVAEAVRKLGEWLSEAIPQVADFVERMGGVKGVLIAVAAINLLPLIAGIRSLAVAFSLAGGPARAVVAALAGIFFYRKELAEFFGITQAMAPKAPTAMPASPVGPAPDASKWRSKVDVSGTIGIDINAKRAAIMRSETMHPGLQFEALSRGTALGAQ